MIILGILFSLFGGAASVLGFLVRSSEGYRMGDSLSQLQDLPLVGGLVDALDIAADFSNKLVDIAFFGGLFLFALGLVLIIAGALVKSRKGGKTSTCVCGAKVPVNSRFCLSCGRTLKCEEPISEPSVPEAAGGLRCPTCGAVLENEEQQFCMNCGAGLKSAAPAPEPEPQGHVCPTCGNPVDPSLPFCCNCGAYLGSTSADPEPEPQRLVCSGCGSPLEEGQRFCMNCGMAVETPHSGYRLDPEPEPVRMPEPKVEPEPEYTPIPVPPAPAPQAPEPHIPATPEQELPAAPVFKSTFKKR